MDNAQRDFRKSLLKSSAFLVCAALCWSCGNITTGGTRFSNDFPPQGTIAFQGSFGTNSSEITGQVFVYTTGSSFVVRLENFSVPSNSSTLRVVGTTSNGNEPLDTVLRATSGSQNYSVTGSVVGAWSNVKIVSSTIAPPNNILATAILDSTQVAALFFWQYCVEILWNQRLNAL